MSHSEVELKLLIDSADIAKLRRHPLLKTLCPAGPATRKLLSIYFDTDDLFLKRSGIALRVRRDGRRWIQTLKGGGSVVAGLHQRNEWEAPLTDDRPDFSLITDPAMAELFAGETLRRQLRPVFVTEFSRTAWQLETATGDQVELALDVGAVRAGSAQTAISEIELELKSGEPAALFDLALALQQRVALVMENASKAERGYALCSPGTQPAAVKAGSPEITGAMSVNEAFAAIAWSGIGQLQANQSGLRHGYDAECVHQMRVAVRRLRSAMGLFAVAAPGIRDAQMDGELRWLLGELGPARDWDVFMEQLVQPVAAAVPHDSGMQWLQASARKRCQAQREKAQAAAASQRTQKLLLGLCGWLCREPWRNARNAAQLDRQAGAFASGVLGKRQRKTLRRGRHLSALDDEQRHALRIAVKKLRYGVEYFAGLYPVKGARRHLAALAALQDQLGALNDQRMAARLLAEIAAAAGSARRSHAVGVATGWNLCRRGAQLAGLGKAWKRFKRCKVFWGDEVA